MEESYENWTKYFIGRKNERMRRWQYPRFELSSSWRWSGFNVLGLWDFELQPNPGLIRLGFTTLLLLMNKPYCNSVLRPCPMRLKPSFLLGLIYKQWNLEGGVRMAQWVAFLLLTQRPRVWFLVCLSFFQRKIWCGRDLSTAHYLERVQSLIVDQTNLVLVSGKLIRQNKQWN